MRHRRAEVDGRFRVGMSCGSSRLRICTEGDFARGGCEPGVDGGCTAFLGNSSRRVALRRSL